MTLFVIGAGATRGCSFVDVTKNPCLPPTNDDYFSQLQKISNPKNKILIKDVMKHAVNVFGVNFSVSMETVFTTYEHMLKMVDATGAESNYTTRQLREMLEKLRQSIHAVLEESLVLHDTSAGSSRKMNICKNYDLLVSDIMRKNDAVISFNYDCVLDDSLRRKGNNKWSPRYGYAFHLGSQGALLTGDDYWKPSQAASKDDTIRYYKLHGSLNFHVEQESNPKSPVKLKQRPYTRQNGNPRFTIIPPEWNKSFDQGFFGSLWQKAAQEIRKHKAIVVIGYSMPPTDLHSSSLFRTSMKAKSIKSLIVVNPDQAARRRIRDTFSTGLDNESKVISCDTFREFVNIDRKVWA